MSFAQQRLWFLAQLEGPSATYNIPVALRLAGDLDAAALAAALADVAGRHEVLRTVFPAVGRPAVPAGPGRRPRLDWELPGQPRSPSRTWPGRWRGIGASRSTWPPRCRCGCGCCGWRRGEHVLVVVLHHIAGDGWSMGPLAGICRRRMRRGARGEAPGWAPLPVQYADYALWQREVLGEEDDPGSLLAEQVAYWREALAGAPEELALPADRPRPAVPSHRGHAVPLDVPAGVHRELAGAGPRARGDDVHGGAGRAGGAVVAAGRG